VALILAVNPGSAHNPTLSRMARELQGCEIVGAESCAIAIKAIKNRVPDVLLLPASRPRGEADLRAYLRRIPGGIPTLTLPPVETADPLDLVRQVRELLAGTSSPPRSTPVPVRSQPKPVRKTPVVVNAPVPAPVLREVAPVGASPEILAAGAATITWIRARRAQWAETIEPYDFSPVAAVVPSAPIAPSAVDPHYYEPIELPDEPLEPHEADQPADGSTDAGVSSGVARFLPRAAAIAVAVGVMSAGAWYWSRAGRESANPAQPAANATGTPVSVETAPPTPLETTAKPAPELEATLVAPAQVPVTIVSPFDVSITEGERPVAIDAQRRVMLAPGKHRLRLQNNERQYDETRTVQVVAGKPATLTITPDAAISVTSNEPAEVLIDGTRVGDTPYEGKVSLGGHTVTVRTPGAERQLKVDAGSSPIQLEVDFSKP
jgi:hypothetical protein